MQHEEYWRCFEIYYLQTTFVVGQVTSAFQNILFYRKTCVDTVYCMMQVLHPRCQLIRSDLNKTWKLLHSDQPEQVQTTLRTRLTDIWTPFAQVPANYRSAHPAGLLRANQGEYQMTKDNIDYNINNPADDLVAEAAGGPGYVEEHSQPNRLSGR